MSRLFAVAACVVLASVVCLAAIPPVHRGRPTGGFLGLPKHTAADRERAIKDVITKWYEPRAVSAVPRRALGV